MSSRNASVSERKLRANKSNAQKSTGPRTPLGTRRSSANATSHGLFCQPCLLPGEDAHDFLGFRHGLLTSLHPLNPAELLLADAFVSARWRLLRLRKAEQVLYATRDQELRDAAEDDEADIQCITQDLHELLGDDSPDTANEPPADTSGDAADDAPTPHNPAATLFPEVVLATFLAAGEEAHKHLDRLCRYEQRLELTAHRALRDFRQLQKDRRDRAEHDDHHAPYLPPLPDPRLPDPADDPRAPGKNEPTESATPAPNDGCKAITDAPTFPPAPGSSPPPPAPSPA